jgi:ornithine--oxo-acid transaminase
MGSNRLQTGSAADAFIELETRFAANIYDPLPVVIARAAGAWVNDVEGRRYFDALAGYGALNFGHCHPRLVAAASAQLDRVTLTSRAFHNDQLGPFCRELAETFGMDRVLPMNTGAEAVETAIKVVRKWGYECKGVPAGAATIIVCEGNFHGRTTTIVSFSDDPMTRRGFGPFSPGFVTVPYGDADALEAAIDESTVAFLVEPIQGEAGVIFPPHGYLARAREICTRRGVLLVADEVQSGLGRTGSLLACDHEGVRPDVVLLGKALGGGIVPLSAVLSTDDVLGTLGPGQHGSTFGGNPLACAIGREVLRLLVPGDLQEAAWRLGQRLTDGLQQHSLAAVREVRGLGLWIGVELKASAGSARARCEELLQRGVLCKETHASVLRVAPPLITTPDEIDWLVELLSDVLERP